MIVDYETLLKELGESEIAYVSADFWFKHQNPSRFKDIDLHSPIWAELRAFQYGWARCKQFYNIKD